MKGRRIQLTDAGVGRLKPDTTEYAVWDSEVPGLGVRVRPSGHRGFVWHGRVQGEPVRATVGPAALMTVEDARKQSHGAPPGSRPAQGGRTFRRSPVPRLRTGRVVAGVPPPLCPVVLPIRQSCARAAADPRLRPIPAGRHPADRRRTVVRRLQPHRPRRGQQGARDPRPDHERRPRRRPCGDRSRQGHREEPPPETHPVPLRRRDRKASPRPRPAGRRSGPPAGNRPTSSGCSCSPAAGRARS